MEPDLEQIAQAFIDGYPEFSADEQRLVGSVYELLATGRPASPPAVAEAAGWAPDEVKRRLDTWGAVFRDRHGDVVGFYGFAIEELTGHRIDLGAIGSGWTWCAYDTLFIPHLLDVTATVQSPCPTTGEGGRVRRGDGGRARRAGPPRPGRGGYLTSTTAMELR